MTKRTVNGYLKLMKVSPLILGGYLMGLTGASYALGLGDINLKSHLNEPLNAEVELLSAGTLSKHEIIVALATPEAFDKAGVEYSFFLNQLKFKPVFKKDGKVFLSIKTKKSVKEPFLDFLVDIRWPNGRLQREYTLLLDPPIYSEEPSSSAVTAPSTTRSTPSTQTYAPSATKNISTNDGGFSSYSVKSGDTLWAVARKVTNRDGHTMQQRMVAIYSANPSAFIRNNINNLKKGATLKIPDSETIGSVSQNQALLEIAASNQKFAGRSAGSRPSSVVDTADYGSSRASNPSKEDRLKLASPENSSSDAAAVAALESEAVTTLSEENKALKLQLTQQAERLAKMERLLELKDSGLASINQSSSESATSEANDERVALSSDEAQSEQNQIKVDNEEQPIENSDSENNLSDSDETNLNDEATANVDVQEDVVEPTQENNPPLTKPVVKTNKPVASLKPVVAEKGFLDKILDMGTTTLISISSGIILLFLIIFLWLRRKGMSDESYQSSLSVPMDDGLNEEHIKVGSLFKIQI